MIRQCETGILEIHTSIPSTADPKQVQSKIEIQFQKLSHELNSKIPILMFFEGIPELKEKKLRRVVRKREALKS